MRKLNLKPNHSAVKAYYKTLNQFQQLHIDHEFAVRTAFQHLLDTCGKQFEWKVVPEWRVRRGKHSHIQVDGALVDHHRLVRGFWEAKDSNDDLMKEIKHKLEVGYPDDNVIFQSPDRAVLFQNGIKVLDCDLRDSNQLISILRTFFEYLPPAYEEWEDAVAEFRHRIPELAHTVLEQIKKEYRLNSEFANAFEDFLRLCRESLNPNISCQAVEEMLIQHLLTERILRKIFDNPDFTRRNTIAVEIERVIQALTKRSFNRDEFLRKLDRFYKAIEMAASTIADFYQKQQFLNSVYEEFFQGFSVKIADTHGIVYTPEVVVSFMINSVKDILAAEFGKSLSDPGVHIIDPFVGTGNFVVHIMRELTRLSLPRKYKDELHCNEVMLLPYYIASMNIEHEFYELMGHYEPFRGICLVDTFELYDTGQQSLTFNRENTERIVKQRRAPIFVVIGNPPYNAWQINENDNNKNRKYEALDKGVARTYMADSKATNKSALCDPYVKAFRWASDRIGSDGIVAFITNNSFLDDYAFDGMRKHLGNDFSSVYHINLKGNARTSGERRRREGGNIFDDQIRVSVGITFLIRKKDSKELKPAVYVTSVENYFRAEDKSRLLRELGSYKNGNFKFKRCEIDENNTWLTEDLRAEFSRFTLLGKPRRQPTSEASVFNSYSNAVKTNRDAWVYGETRESVLTKVALTIKTFNEHVSKWRLESARGKKIEEIFDYDDRKISWSSDLKREVEKLRDLQVKDAAIRVAMYRPYCKRFLYFDYTLNERIYSVDSIFPTGNAGENIAICCSAVANNKPFHCLAVNITPDIHLTGDSQIFPYYIYDENGTRRENIPDAILHKFQVQYQDTTISKSKIFEYVYAVLHHPAYRDRYAANLRRELPRVPFCPDFHGFANAGKRLLDLHLGFEDQPEFSLKKVENKRAEYDLAVSKMRLNKSAGLIVYNHFLTLEGIPEEAFEYKLGTISALEWIVDQFQVSRDRRSQLERNPNVPNDSQQIIELLGKIITVSLETNRIVLALPSIGIGEAKKAVASATSHEPRIVPRQG